MSAATFRARRDDESVGDYHAARDAYNLRQLYARVAQLESDNKALAAANAGLLATLIEMWHRHAELAHAQGDKFTATQWELYAARLVQLGLDN